MSTEFFAPAKKDWQVRQTPLSKEPNSGAPRPVAALGNRLQFLQSTAGNRAVLSLLRNNFLQAKLRVSEPGDEYEREADYVAETVMRMPEGVNAGTERSGDEVPHVFRAVDSPAHSPEVSGEVESAVLAQTIGGQPLTPSARAFFEPRFNSDLSYVRIHTDTQAAESARSVGARAFTLGNHIVFDEAEYSPDNAGGRKLLAHELVHVMQQGGSARRVQRQVAVEDPVTTQATTQTATQTASPAISVPAGTSSAGASNTVLTNWFVDFSGVANNGRNKGRGNRDPGDVLILEDFTVGPKDDSRTFAKAGDALNSGYSKLGTYDHPVGPGSAGGTVSYANRRELDVELSWDGQKKRERNPAALAAARQTVETLILHQSDVSGDWNEVERRAGDAAAEHLPDGSNPKVEIKWRGNHQDYALKTVDYDVRRPSLCTAEISVPTTSSAVDYSVSETKEHLEYGEAHTADQSHGDAEAARSKYHANNQSSSSLNVNKEHEKDTSDEHYSKKTHTYTDYEVTLEDIEKSSSYVFTSMVNSLQISWWKIVKKLEEERGDKDVSHEEEQELGWGDKIKKWFVDRGKQVVDLVKGKLIGKLKSWVSGKIKSFIRKLLFVGVEAEAWWFTLLGWGVDWAVGKLGDKIKDKLSVHKSEDHPAPPDKNYVLNSTTTVQLQDEMRNSLHVSEIRTETEKDIKEHFRNIFESDERSSADKTHEHSSDSLAAKAKANSSSDADASHMQVRVAADHQESADSAEGDHTTTTRAYHGTTIKITAGQPVLTVKIQEKP